MMEQLFGHNIHHPYFALADSSQLLTADIRQKLEKAGQVDWETIRYQNQPATRQVGRSTLDFFHMAACKSASLAELKDRTAGYLALAEQEQVLDALQALAPVFVRLVWNSSFAHADSQRIALASYASQHDLSTFFERAIRFYGAAIPDTMDYGIYLNPIPRGFGFFTAHPYQSLLTLDLPATNHDWPGDLSIVFHEVCHVLYAEQPPAVQLAWEQLMLPPTKDRFRKGLPYAWIDEGLATAVGNGACYQFLNGHTDTANWYFNGTINGYGHALYRPVNQLLARKESFVTANFRDTAVTVFYRCFPKAQLEPDRTFPFYVMISDALEPDVWDQAIGSRVRGRYTQSAIPLDAEAISLMQTSVNIGVVVIRKNHLQTWANLGKRLPSVARLSAPQNRKAVSKGGWYIYEKDADGRPWLLINAIKDSDVKAALSRLPWMNER